MPEKLFTKDNLREASEKANHDQWVTYTAGKILAYIRECRGKKYEADTILESLSNPLILEDIIKK